MSDSAPLYTILLHQESLDQIISYKNSLVSKTSSPGGYLEKVLKNFTSQGGSLENTKPDKFIELLLSTKKPKLFATHIKCDSKDWTRLELSILGNLNIAVPVEVYDNGVWYWTDENFKIHKNPFPAELLYTPGPLLRSGNTFKGTTPDYDEVVIHEKIDQMKFNKMINRRISPLLAYSDKKAGQEGKQALIIISGLGCGVFAGKFKGHLAPYLNLAIRYTLETNGQYFKNIACVIFDPHGECDNETEVIEGVKYRVRPFEKGNKKSQLCEPGVYAESGDDFSNCKLFKLVAWDHVSYPGNNFFRMVRMTDDGVAAAATSSMETFTNVKGKYVNGKYYPPKEYENWEDVIKKLKIGMRVNKNVFVFKEGGDYLSLDEF